MLDIETMGTGANACIASIGLVRFCVSSIGECEIIDTAYYLPKWEGDMDYSTVQWWLTQTVEAQKNLVAMDDKNKMPLSAVLIETVRFVGDEPIWGNGSDFDNMIVLSHCKRLGIKGWSYRNNRCFRTVKNLYAAKAYTKPEIPHHALYDAIAQAKTLVNISVMNGIPL